MHFTRALTPLTLALGLSHLALADDASSILSEGSSILSVETQMVASILAHPSDTALANSFLSFAASVTEGPFSAKLTSLAASDPTAYSSFESSASSVAASLFSQLEAAEATQTATDASAQATSSSSSDNAAAGVPRSLVGMGVAAVAVVGLALAL